MEKDLTAAEKRANAARENALRDLAALQSKLISGTVLAGKHEPTGLSVFADPVSLGTLIAQLLVQQKQMEIALGALTDLLLEAKLVAHLPDEKVPEEHRATAPPVLAPHPLTLEAFWLQVAKSAEATTSILRRGVLSQGLAGQSIIHRQ